MWFERLTGFAEESPEQVRSSLSVDDGYMISHKNGKRFRCGELTTPSLSELRAQVQSGPGSAGKTTIREIVADVQRLHADEKNAGSLFQVASQFNLLEMVSPLTTPEQGVGIYQNDRTQGPACAIAAGAGTIYRNYFVPLNGRIGQSTASQIDCLADLGKAFGNSSGRLWEMKNGYALATERGLTELTDRLRGASDAEHDRFRGLLRIGVHVDTQVTLDDATHTVSQAYCSALPVAYSPHPSHRWQPFARLVLEASYEATLCAAILNSARSGSRTVFLTLLGGGAFGNETDWIISAIRRALELYADHGLDVAIVSYGTSRPSVQRLISMSEA